MGSTETQARDMGSSPRVRSRRCAGGGGSVRCGIISACAEQTNSIVRCRYPDWDHLRVCGADARQAAATEINRGSSPRVRSRPTAAGGVRIAIGIISACAEQTTNRWQGVHQPWDHLRVCGADTYLEFFVKAYNGSSPRVRSRRCRARAVRLRFGIISACAEQTGCLRFAGRWCWDHLRVCGADLWCGSCVKCMKGSSPRVRSRHRQDYRHSAG